MNVGSGQEITNREPHSGKKLPWWREFLFRFFLFGSGMCAVNALFELHHAGRPILGVILDSVGLAFFLALVTSLIHMSDRSK